MLLKPFRFYKLLKLDTPLNLCNPGNFEGNFEDKLENHGEIPHVLHKNMGSKGLIPSFVFTRKVLTAAP